MITTVLGDINSENLKYVLPHEHLFCDLRPLVTPIDDEDFYKELSLKNFGKVLRNPYSVLDNTLIGGLDIQSEEVSKFKEAGGSLIADVTTEDFGRDINSLCEVSKRTGVYIVTGCGHYVNDSVTAENKELSKKEIREKIIKELTLGIGDSSARAGVIGEIGTGMKMSDFEKKIARGSIRGAKRNGLWHAYSCLPLERRRCKRA